MKRQWILVGVAVVLPLLALAAGLHGLAPTITMDAFGVGGVAMAQGPAPQSMPGNGFTYQGQLLHDGSPITTTCDMAFSLYDGIAGAQVGSTINATVAVTNGLFTVALDFGGGMLNGQARALGIRVDCGGDSADLGRQALTPAPVALALPGLWTQQNETSPNLVGGYYGNSLGAGVAGATIGGGGNSGTPNQVLVSYGAVGGGAGNKAITATYTTVGGGLSNQASGQCAAVAGGRDNQAGGQYASIAGGFQNRASGGYAAVGGGYGNQASAISATVGGGSANQASAMAASVAGGYQNQAAGDYAAIGGGEGNRAITNAHTTIGGGYQNQASGLYAFIGGGRDNQASGGGAVVGGGVSNQVGGGAAVVGGGSGNQASGSTATVGGGQANQAGGLRATVGGGYQNQAGGDDATIGGGEGNRAVTGTHTTVGGGYQNRASGQYAAVGGGYQNKAITGTHTTVAGGYQNQASGSYAAVAGGYQNRASGSDAAVGGGESNWATIGSHITIGGGYSNEASGDYAVVGGGIHNGASGNSAFIGAGSRNGASGQAAAVPGGFSNEAGGDFSFAAGYRAKANQNGCFVWGDSTCADVTCDTANAFVARTSGGATFYSNAGMTTGVTMAAGGGSWSSVSDRALKADVVPADGGDVLARLMRVPVSTWNYTSQDPSIRHMGPMAQDFYAAFGLGEDDRHIGTVDADGVALAAIQALAAENAALKSQNAAQQQALDDLQKRMAALEAVVNGGER